MKYTDEKLKLLDVIEVNKPETVSFDNEAIKAMVGDTLERSLICQILSMTLDFSIKSS